MAINVDISKITGINQVGNSYQRKSAVPLDYFSLFNTKAEAVAYAASNPVSYVGQVISYIDDTDNGKVKVCVIADTVGTLREVGTKPVGDGKSITVNEEGIVSILGVDSADSLTLPRMKEDKSGIEWVPVSQVVEGDGNDNTTYEITALTKTSGEGEAQVTETYGIKVKTLFNGKEVEGGEFTIAFDVYTKTEVDAAIKVIADKVGVPAEGDTDTKTLYERIAVEVLRATNAESALSDRIGVAKNGEAAATGVYAYVDGVVEALVNGVDAEKIDSLNELIAWVEAHPAIVEELDGRLDKVEAILDGIGDTENGEKATVKAYVDDAFTAHEQAADGKYATKTEIEAAGYAVASEVANTYVTKETATVESGLRFINQTEINKLAKLNLDNGEITISGSVNANQVKELYDTVVNIVKGSTADLDPDAEGAQNGLNIEEGAEVNIIEAVKVNGTALTPDANRAVNIEISSDTLTDSEALKKSISDAAALAQNGVDNAATAQATAEAAQGSANAAQGTANEALGTANNNAGEIATIKASVYGTKEDGTDGLVKKLAALETEVHVNVDARLDAVEAALSGSDESDGLVAIVTSHTGELATLKDTTIPALQGAINGKVAQGDFDALNAKVDTADKKVSEYVAGEIAKIPAYDDTAVKQLISDEADRAGKAEAANKLAIEAIYKVGEGEAEATGLLAEEIARAKAAEKANADDIVEINALLNTISDTDDITSLKELALWVQEHETEVLPVIEQQGKDIDALELKVNTGDKDVATYVADAIADIPMATAITLGLVKSATDVEGKVAVNKVYVGTDGVGEVKAISTDLLVQGEFELILNGGNASLTA